MTAISKFPISNPLRIMATVALVTYLYNPAIGQNIDTDYNIHPEQSIYSDSLIMDDNFAWRMFQSSDILTHISPEYRTIYTAPSYELDLGDPTPTFGITAFAPLIFDISKLLSLTEPLDDIANVVAFRNRTLFPQAENQEMHDRIKPDWVSNSTFGKSYSMWERAMGLREHLFRSNPDLVIATTLGLPKDKLSDSHISHKDYAGQFERDTDRKAMLEDVQIRRETIVPVYWTKNFLIDIHFAQNEISNNWYKGGQSNLNLNGRLFLDATYNKDKVKWVNQLEYKVGVFTQTETERRKFQIGEDIFTALSNLGLKASDHWFYTLEAVLRTQLLNNYSSENLLVTRPFAPLKTDLGLGMKYDVDLKNLWNNPFARLRFTANLSPLSAQLIYTWNNDVDKARVGLQEDQNFLFRLGSTIRTEMIWDFTSYLSWESRFYYNTSYGHIETEFENQLYYALSRFFSLKLGVNLRFDDSVILDEPKVFKNLLQYNQLFSLGFTYKL